MVDGWRLAAGRGLAQRGGGGGRGGFAEGEGSGGVAPEPQSSSGASEGGAGSRRLPPAPERLPAVAAAPEAAPELLIFEASLADRAEHCCRPPSASGAVPALTGLGGLCHTAPWGCSRFLVPRPPGSSAMGRITCVC